MEYEFSGIIRQDTAPRNSIRKAVESCQTKADKHRVTMKLQLPSGSITTAIDSFHIERALVNLCDNTARKELERW